MALKQHLDYDKSVDVVFGIKNKTTDQALVFIIRGIATKWKQPIAYFFAELILLMVLASHIAKFCHIKKHVVNVSKLLIRLLTDKTILEHF